MVDLTHSYEIIETLLDARTAPSNHVAPAAPAASAKAGHANVMARTPPEFDKNKFPAKAETFPKSARARALNVLHIQRFWLLLTTFIQAFKL